MNPDDLWRTESSTSHRRLGPIPTDQRWVWRRYAPGELILPHGVSLPLNGIVFRGTVEVASVRPGYRAVVDHVHKGECLSTEAWVDEGWSVEFRAFEPTVVCLIPLDVSEAVAKPVPQARLQARTRAQKEGAAGSNRRWVGVTLLVTAVLFSAAAWHWQTSWRALLSRLAYGLASYELQDAQYDSAMALLQASADLDARLARAHNDLGYIHYQRGRLDEAQAAFQKALEADPAFAVAINNLGFCYLERGQVKPASAALKKAVALDPEDPAAWTNLGTAETLAGHPEEAIYAYRAALRTDPENLVARVNLGSLLYKQGQHGEARDHLQAALDAQPDLPRARLIVGAVALSEGNPEGAWAEFQLAAPGIPDDPLLHFFLALGYEEAGQWEDAGQELAKVLALEPHPDLAALARSHLVAFAGSRQLPSTDEETKGE